MPSCDQIGVPIHFHSSTTSGSASLMSLRILPRVSPRQSPSSAILFEMSSDADRPWLAPDFFMFSSRKLLQFRCSQPEAPLNYLADEAIWPVRISQRLGCNSEEPLDRVSHAS